MPQAITPLDAVHLIARTLSSNLDPDEAMRRTLEVAVEVTAAEGGSILRHDPEQACLRFRHVVGEKAPQLVGYCMPDTEGVVGRVFHTNEASIDNDAASAPNRSRRVDEEMHFVTRDLATVPLCYPGGQVIGVIQVVNKRDGKFSEQDLEVLGVVASIAAMSIQNADLAKQAERAAVLQYLGDLAHDIKNRVTFLTPSVDLLDSLVYKLQTGPVDADRLERFCVCASAALRGMSHGAQRILVYTEFLARAAEGQPILPKLARHDLAKIARETVDDLMPKARCRGVTISCESAGPISCTVDPMLIDRALFNLAINAFAATPRGGEVVVRVRQEDDYCALEVCDSGQGMTAEALARVLAGEAISTKPGGIGLGTAIVKRVVDLHQGTWEGESDPGKGTAFRIRLPLAREASREG
jgi:signal transduction histidine kinase